MTKEIPFAKSLVNGYLMMLDCSTRRSIIRTLAHVKKNGLKKYINKRWTVRYLGTQDYSVRSNTGKTMYLARDFEDTWLGTSGFSIYKKEEKKKCEHEWFGDSDTGMNVCTKCPAIQDPHSEPEAEK